MTFSVSGLPSSLNTWGHWSKRSKAMKEWADRIGLILLSKGYRKGRPQFDGEVSVSIAYHVAPKLRKQKPDLDNYAPKALIDAMKGYVFEDDAQVGELVQRIVRDSDRDETVIEVTAL